MASDGRDGKINAKNDKICFNINSMLISIRYENEKSWKSTDIKLISI
jgi:hypothetical protein